MESIINHKKDIYVKMPPLTVVEESDLLSENDQ
jgi:hypothetical protein